MDNVKIQTVCGFGCGSSLFLRMKIESILKANGADATVFCGDVATCLTNECDAIFISEELSERIKDRAKVPVFAVKNFMNTQEVTEKVLEFIQSKK
jgi:PTS system ascorbate-specific IIB component